MRLRRSLSPSSRTGADAAAGAAFGVSDPTANAAAATAAAGGGAGAAAAATGSTWAAAAPDVASAAQNAALVPFAGLGVEIAVRRPGGARSISRSGWIRRELGRIDVRGSTVDRQGRVTSHLVAERSDTLDLLRRDPASASCRARCRMPASRPPTARCFPCAIRISPGRDQQGRPFKRVAVARLVIPHSKRRPSPPPLASRPMAAGSEARAAFRHSCVIF